MAAEEKAEADRQKTLARELGVKEAYVNNVITLIDEGNTIPFIAR